MAISDDTRAIRRLKDHVAEGVVPAEIFSSEEIFELERERIFKKQWIFMAHESEIPDAGDYLVRNLLDQSFIVVRGEDGEVRVLANICRHQGMEVCRSDRGNSSHFRCPYHGWTYDNTGELAGVHMEEFAYGEDFEKGEWSLREAPRYDEYGGMIFVNLDEDAEPLEEFLGEYTFYLDFLVGRSPEGLEFRGPQRRVVELNWKTPVINNIGDSYHAGVNHMSALEIGILAGAKDDETPTSGEDHSYHADPEKGNPTQAGAGAGNCRPNQYVFEWYPEEIQQLHREALTDEHRAVIEEFGPMLNSSLFPNLTWLNATARVDEDDVVHISNVRLVNPISPTRSEVLIWHGIEKEAPPEYKDKSYKAKVFQYGTSGLVTQDDAHAWSELTKATRRSETTSPELTYRIGTDHEPLSGTPGPGTVYPYGLSETNQRYYLELYADAMTDAD